MSTVSYSQTVSVTRARANICNNVCHIYFKDKFIQDTTFGACGKVVYIPGRLCVQPGTFDNKSAQFIYVRRKKDSRHDLALNPRISRNDRLIE